MSAYTNQAMVGEVVSPFCRFKRSPNGTPLVCEKDCLVPAMYASLEEYALALGTQYDEKVAEGFARIRCLRLRNGSKPKQFPQK